MTTGTCAPTKQRGEDAVRQAYTMFQVFKSLESCDSLCARSVSKNLHADALKVAHGKPVKNDPNGAKKRKGQEGGATVSLGRKCDAGTMWAALADSECALFDALLRSRDKDSLGCTGGCEHDAEGVHAPVVDANTAVCMLPAPASMSCARSEPPVVTHKLCPCL
jgi:hypothetical protein